MRAPACTAFNKRLLSLSFLQQNTRYTAKQNFYKHRVNTINVGKQSVTFMAIDIWKDLPSYFKDLRKCISISQENKTLPPVRTKTKLTLHQTKSVDFRKFFLSIITY